MDPDDVLSDSDRERIRAMMARYVEPAARLMVRRWEDQWMQNYADLGWLDVNQRTGDEPV